MSSSTSGALPPLGGGANRPGVASVGGGGLPTSRADQEAIRIGNLDPDSSAAPSSKPPTGEPAAAPTGLQPSERQYKRQPVNTGRGAVRCKTFHVKLNDAALAYMDEMVNSWLEQHGYEVKFSHMTIGVFQGKTMEQHLIVQVWY